MLRTMSLAVVGAGLPRTGTYSLKHALERLLGGRCYHMTEITGYPFALGPRWNTALDGGTPDWDLVFDDYVAAVDWPASMFWRPLSKRDPRAHVLLSTRGSTDEWWRSIDATILPVAREAAAAGSRDERGLLALLERFAATATWDDPVVLKAAYERHNEEVRRSVPPGRLIEWSPDMGWEPLCRGLGLAVPDDPFPRLNTRQEWSAR